MGQETPVFYGNLAMDSANFRRLPALDRYAQPVPDVGPYVADRGLMFEARAHSLYVFFHVFTCSRRADALMFFRVCARAAHP